MNLKTKIREIPNWPIKEVTKIIQQRYGNKINLAILRDYGLGVIK